MAGGGPKQFPNLAKYLETRKRPSGTNSVLVAQIILGSFGALAFLAATLILGIGFLVTSHLLVAGLIPLGMALGCAISTVLVSKLGPKKAPPTQLQLEAKVVNDLLSLHMRERRVHKAAPPAVTSMLEESARQYVRIQAALSGSFWRSPDLPPVYANLRDKARVASDSAMEELVVMLRPRISENTRPQHWRDVVDEVAENMGFKVAETGHIFPRDLEPVRHLAEGLHSLANEVEQATIRAITETPGSPNADSALRSCLSELRSLNDAESELDQTLKNRG
jgi:hypothetical protein